MSAEDGIYAEIRKAGGLGWEWHIRWGTMKSNPQWSFTRAAAERRARRYIKGRRRWENEPWERIT